MFYNLFESVFYTLQSPAKRNTTDKKKHKIWFIMKYVFRIWFNSSSAPWPYNAFDFNYIEYSLLTNVPKYVLFLKF